jgi:hypothetical protein
MCFGKQRIACLTRLRRHEACELNKKEKNIVAFEPWALSSVNMHVYVCCVRSGEGE